MQDYDDRPEQDLDREVTLETTVSVQWNNDAVIQEVIKKLANRIYHDIKPKVETAIIEAVNDQVNTAVIATLDTEIQPTDRWGNATEEKVSVRAMLQRDAEEWLNEHVDSSGRHGSNSYGQSYPRIHWIVQEALNGEKDRRGKTQLHQMVIAAAKSAIGDVTAVVEGEVRKQAREALGLES